MARRAGNLRVQRDGSVEGYRIGRTLRLRVELARQLRRRRTRLILGALAVLPLLLLLAFEVGDDGSGGSTADAATSSGLGFTAFVLTASTGFLLVVAVALLFGDAVSSEASWGSLRYLLAAPVPRLRLLRQKAAVAALLGLLGMGLLMSVALGAGLFWYGTGDLLTGTGETVDFVAGLIRVALACGYVAVQLSWVAGLALLLSVSTDAPLGAVGGTVAVSIVSQILDQIEVLGQLRGYLPTHFSRAYADLLNPDIDWTDMTRGAFSALAYATAFTVLAGLRFHRKDITS
ncbi:ABC transporter permease [Saccharopolyspora sp. HNM0983]|uniref:ABC transporter permease n=1 Tax=Saccharopolyspora montiporae TaxID=2781240 RepID=A0A929BCK9_9PSEU|nr:ABC transporter permease [Saccharopolyspora sp. HNM0983]